MENGGKKGPLKLEQRKNDRVTLSLSVRYKVFDLKNLEKDVQEAGLGQRGLVQDLSLGGLQIRSEKAFAPGEVLELETDLPGKGPVRTLAKVVWCKPEGPGTGFCSGIQFIPIGEEELASLQDFFKATP